MEFLSYSLEDRTSMFLDGIEFSIDVLARNKNLTKNLDTKDICDFDKNMMVLDRETVIPNSFLGSTFYGVSSSNEMNDSLIHKEPSTMVNLDHFTQDFELGREHYGPNNQKESVLNNLQMDMEMEKCIDSKDISSIFSSEESMVEDSLPAKKVRITDLCSSLIPVCQVQGCYKDLSSSKDYHKRHRVCDIHSKTAKVIIRGIEQRFCQQCSRFHLLSEFDDGKRSCRKRLAGHNQRRRKPQFSTAAALDSKFFRLSLMKTESFHSHKTFADDDFIYQERKNKQMKLSTLLPIGISEESLANFPVIRNKHHSRTCINGGAVVDSSSPPCALSLLSAKSSDKQGRNHHSTGFLKMMTTPSSTKENQDQKSTKTENRKQGFVQTADFDDYISPEIESTVVDLVELSSHLQRVQQLRNSM